jgi:hypothetical protein
MSDKDRTSKSDRTTLVNDWTTLTDLISTAPVDMIRTPLVSLTGLHK